MCFAPQRRALFRHVNFQKCSEAEVLGTFWLGNVLRATTACTFSTSQLPKAVWGWGALYILTSTCASRHNCVQFFISHLATWLRTRRFSERAYLSTLRSLKSLEKHSVSRLSYLFAHLHLLSSHSFSSLIFSLLLFSSLTLPTTAFPSVHIVGSLTSKTSFDNHYIILSFRSVYIYIYIYTPVVPTWGGAEAALELYYKTFFIYRTCMRRAPARPCMRALCDCDALFQRSHLKLHTSHFTLRTYTSHSTLHLISSHLSSSRLISALLISSLLICHLSSSQLLNLSTAQPFSSHRSSSQLILALLHVTKLLLLGRSFLHAKITAQKRLLHTEAWDIDAFTQTSL